MGEVIFIVSHIEFKSFVQLILYLWGNDTWAQTEISNLQSKTKQTQLLGWGGWRQLSRDSEEEEN